MKPVIGILARPDYSSSGHDSYLVHQAIIESVVTFGALPIVLVPPVKTDFSGRTIETTPPLTEEEWQEWEKQLRTCDGILLQGGNNYYDYDLRTVHYAFDRNIPLLGICLGMQTISAAFGGTEETLSDLSHKSKEEYVHSVILNPDSYLCQIVNQPTIRVNSRHRYVVKTTPFSVAARSDDDIIEAIEDRSRDFFIGVQWHPENLKSDPATVSLFREFIKQASQKRK